MQAFRFLLTVPTARLYWLPGLSHIPISDDPGKLSRILLDFLADHINADHINREAPAEVTKAA